MDQPSTWRMLRAVAVGHGEAGEGGAEEMVFTIQGIVCAIEFPPLTEKPS